MPVADPEAALRELMSFVEHCEAYAATFATTQGAEHDEAIRLKLAMVRAIAEEENPDLINFFVPSTQSAVRRWSHARDGAIRLIGQLTDAAEIARITQGSGPSISAASLHPWVWHAASDLWSNGHHAVAVQQAATALDNHCSAKLSVDLSGKDLYAHAFSTDPPTPTRPRLRFKGFERGTADWTSAHDGAKHYGMGCAQRIRNLRTHKVGGVTEQQALEELAALSLLARWVDIADVEQSQP